MSSPFPKSFHSPRTRWLQVWGLALAIVGIVQSTQAVDVFDRHGSAVLKQIVEADTDAKTREFTQLQLIKLKPLGKDIDSSCLVVETNGGNLSKVLVSWGFRKQRQADKPVPVLMLDRFVTYEQGKGDSTVANGRNVMLFPGFSFDFDLGQVVPAGFDADVEFTDKGVIRGLEGVKLHAVSGSQLPATEEVAPGKKSTDAINPEDFTGVWQVDGDGRWIGEWDLNVNEQGEATGKFHSAETQASYPITGQIGGVPHLIKLNVQFNNATQVVEAYLWTKDKAKMAGTFTLAGRKFGMSATRQTVTKKD